MTDREAGRALGMGPGIRYAATTGTVAIRWDGARAPEIWTVAAADIEPADACRELARRYLHIFVPTTAQGFARWAGVTRRAGAAAFASLEESLLPVRSPLGDEWLLADDEPEMQAAAQARPRPCACCRAVMPTSCSTAQSGSSSSLGGSAAAALDAPRLAGRAARRRRDPWHLEAGATHCPDRSLVAPWPRRAAIEAEAGSLPLPGLDREIEVVWSSDA